MKRSRRNGPWARTSWELRQLVDRCVICFSPGDLAVHHVRYRGKRGLAERPQDVVVLCRRHHDDLHRRRFDGPAKFVEYRDQARLIEALLEPTDSEGSS